MNLDPEILLQYTAQLDAMSLIAIISFIVLLLCSALISGTEVAFFSLSKTDIISMFALYYGKLQEVYLTKTS